MNPTSKRSTVAVAALLSLPVIGGVAAATGVGPAEPDLAPTTTAGPGSAPATAPTTAPATEPAATVEAVATIPAPVLTIVEADAVEADTEGTEITEAVPAPELAIVEADTDAAIDEAMPTSEQLDAYAAYWDAGYTYEQLLGLAAEWNVTEFEAKAIAGQAVLDGDTELLAEIHAIEPASPAAADAAIAGAVDDRPLYIAETMAEWERIEDLAAEWNLDIIDAKARLATLDPAEADALVGRG